MLARTMVASRGYEPAGANQTVVSGGTVAPSTAVGTRRQDGDESRRRRGIARGSRPTLQATTTSPAAERDDVVVLVEQLGVADPSRSRAGRDQPPVQRQHRRRVGVLALGGVLAPVGRRRQPRRGGRAGRREAERVVGRGGPRHRDAAAVAPDLRAARAEEHGVLAAVVGQVEHLGEAELLALVEVHGAGHRRAAGRPPPAPGACRRRGRPAPAGSAGCRRSTPRRRCWTRGRSGSRCAACRGC